MFEKIKFNVFCRIFCFQEIKFILPVLYCCSLWMKMALGSGVSVSVGVEGDTVHVNNQPMIVLLVPLRKEGDALGGWGV